ncbi:hypothetical protein CUR178_08259 [Leishmania enriettii]|uniref:SAC3/GANP/THP3 conserved domain-containing protein n=1 Tax=Leishmania enriettii TaxID=5663 RepID=A0A836KS43_LEIEN|nr:hypothetical protein CUR178_08259 [Leishmania enriettii]
MQSAQYSQQQQQHAPPPRQECPSAAATAVDAPYSDANVATVLSLSPFSAFCKLRDNRTAKPLIRGRYTGMCGGDPTQRERREDFEYIALTPSPSAAPHAFSVSARRHTVWGQVEAYSRSAAGKTIDPTQQRTPLALEKSMHFLVEHYLRVPHTPLVYTEPFRIWGYLWDRFRGIRTTWAPQLPPSNVSLQGYVDSETGRMLSAEELHRESYRRVRWLEFTAAALAVGGAYLCCSPEGCQRFMQDKKQFLESMSQCFTDLTVFYRAEQRHRNAEFFSVLLLLYGLQQEMKVEDRSSFCRFHTVMVNGEPRLCPESSSESVNLAQVYRELEKQPYMLETQPVRVALDLIHFWAARQWFQFFKFCRSARMTSLQRAVVFQSFTYARYRAVLDLVLPNHYVYPKLRVRHAIPVAELAEELMMSRDHCLEFLQRMGLGAQLECRTEPQHQQQHTITSCHPITSAPSDPTAATTTAAASGGKAGWHLCLCHPNSDPLVTADELEKRCVNKRVLFFPTYPAFFGFRVSREAYDRFPDAKSFPATDTEDACGAWSIAGSSSPVGRGAVRSPSGFRCRAAPESKAGTLLTRSAAPSSRRGDGNGGDEDSYVGECCDNACSEEAEEEEEEEDGSGSTDNGAYEDDGDERDSPPQRRSTASPPSSMAPSFDKEAALLCQLGCPVNLMEVLEAYCPPYNSEVAALRLSDASEELFALLPKHRAEMLLRCHQARRRARHWQRASALDSSTAAPESDEEARCWVEKAEAESVSTASSLFDGSDEDEFDGEGEENDLDSAAPQHTSGIYASPPKADAAPPAVIIEARQLLATIRQNPLYAAAAADRAEAEEKTRQSKQEEAGAQTGEVTAAAVEPRRNRRLSSPVPFPPKPHVKPQQSAALSESGHCMAAPLPGSYSDDATQHCSSQDSGVVVESPKTLPARRLAGMMDTGIRTQAAPEGREEDPRDTSATQQEPHQSVGREDSAETVEPRRDVQAQTPAAPLPSLSMPPPHSNTSMPTPPASPTADMFTPGKREPVVAAGTDTATPAPVAGQREGDSNSSSSGSSAPMLDYSHLKPLKQPLPDDGENAEESASRDDREKPELLSGSNGSSSASTVDDSKATSHSSSTAQSGTSTPPPPLLWGGQHPLPPPPPTAAIDSFTPRPSPEKRPASSAAGTGYHNTGGETARGMGSGSESGDDAADVEGQAKRSNEGLHKRRKTEAAPQRGVLVQQPSPMLIPASHVDVFARACVPLIEEYLHLWMRLTHEDVASLRAAAHCVLEIREAEATTAAATHSTNDVANDSRAAVHTRQGPLVQWRGGSALRAEWGATAAASAWWWQRRLQRTTRAMALVARQLLTTAVLRGGMSAYGQLMWDLSRSGPARATGGRDVVRAHEAQRNRTICDGGDDARAARLCRGCSAAMLSASDAAAILAAARAQSKRTSVRSADGAESARPSASMRPEVPPSLTGKNSALRSAKASCGAALNEAMGIVFSCGVGAAVLPAHDSLASLLSSAVDVSLDSADTWSRSRPLCATAALQLTSIYIWVSTASCFDCACPAMSAAVADRSAVGAAAFSRLFQDIKERWLVSVMMPPTPFTATAAFAGVGGRGEYDKYTSRRRPSASPWGGKRGRSDVGDDTSDVVWLSAVDIDPDCTSSPSQAPMVVRLFHRDHFSDVPIVRSTVPSPTHDLGAAHHRAPTLPLMTRISLYGCDTHTLPRLRVRRDGGVRATQQRGYFSNVDGNARGSQVTASPDSTRALAMSHAHYTALLAVDIAEPGYMVKARRVLRAVVASHVAYTTVGSARGTAVAKDWYGHEEGVQEQNSVAGVLICLLITPSHVTGTASIAAEVKSCFRGLWTEQHGASEKSSENSAPAAASAPAVVVVDIVYGDAEGAKAAMKEGMHTLMSTYAQQAVAVLAGDS